MATLAVFLLSTATRVRAPGVPAPSPSTPQANAPAPASSAVWPSWLQVHAEHRIRYETIDARYRAQEVGGDQQLDFRTRLQARLATARTWADVEIQDSRVALDDAGSTVSAAQENFAKVLQLHGGVTWRNLGAGKLTAQLEVGRFSRDFGFRRLIARNLYRNTTNAYDGVTARVEGASWNAQLLMTRPVFYTYPVV